MPKNPRFWFKNVHVAPKSQLQYEFPAKADQVRSIMANLRVALYQPDIPGNTGTILRLAACLGCAVDIIEPAGFDISDRSLRRAGMDYLAAATLTRHVNWEHFEAWRQTTGRRLVLASTKASGRYTDFAFRPDDILLFGRESAGVPDHVHDKADARIVVPMVEGQRSINLAVSAAMITGEAMRQTVWA
jgi:tRNA (cytidine/uridine-2'-O-)-methyltransferase